jgi:hypothetical protein
MAAGRLIAIEAGAKVGHYDTIEVTNLSEDINGANILVSSPGVYDQLNRGTQTGLNPNPWK